MAIRIVRLGTKRARGEGLRVGTVRRPPRGVPKADFARRDFYDVWFPNLAPTEPLVKEFFPITEDKDWRAFKRRFSAELKEPGPRRDLDLLAALSHETALSVGCYCEDEARCHRAILREELEKRGADLVE